MTAPSWMNSVIRDFGSGAGIGTLELNERGAAALRFDGGVTLRLEYTGAELVVAAAFPLGGSGAPQADALVRLLAAAHPKARHGLQVRAGVLPKTGEAVLAVRMPERDVTLPRVNAAFAALWRLAGETGGAAWA